MKISYKRYTLILLFALFFCSKEQSFPISEGFITTEDGIRLYYQNIGEGPERIIIPAGMYLVSDRKHLNLQKKHQLQIFGIA